MSSAFAPFAVENRYSFLLPSTLAERGTSPHRAHAVNRSPSASPSPKRKNLCSRSAVAKASCRISLVTLSPPQFSPLNCSATRPIVCAKVCTPKLGRSCWVAANMCSRGSCTTIPTRTELAGIHVVLNKSSGSAALGLATAAPTADLAALPHTPHVTSVGRTSKTCPHAAMPSSEGRGAPAPSRNRYAPFSSRTILRECTPGNSIRHANAPQHSHGYQGRYSIATPRCTSLPSASRNTPGCRRSPAPVVRR